MNPLTIIGWIFALIVLALGAAIVVACVRYTVDEWKGLHRKKEVPPRETLWGVFDDEETVTK